MNSTSRGRRTLAIGLILISGFLLLPFVVPFFTPWTGINSRHQDIDIETGHARYSRRFWFVRISSRVEDTYLSRAANLDAVVGGDMREWRRVNTFSPWHNNSPHHRFHGALNQVRTLELLCEEVALSQARKQEVARQVLTAWQTAGDDTSVDTILRRLMDEEH